MTTSAQHLASCLRAAALTRYSAEARKLSDHDTGCLWAAERRGVALTHVAVTAMRDEVFHGRLFFSEPSSGADGGTPPSAEAAWDCESKASDALWLALTTGAPVLMHKAVWDACALPLQRVLTNTAAALVEEQAAELVVPRVTAAAAAAEERPRLQLTQAAATDAEVTGAEGGEAIELSEASELNANATEALYTVYDTVAMEDSLREIQVAAPSSHLPSAVRCAESSHDRRPPKRT
jgi:bifunctional DNase/RNase